MAPPGLYRVCPVPGRGLGVVATATLPPGHLLLSEAPTMVITEWSATALSSAFFQLPEEQQEQVLGLANSQEGVGRVAGVALTNMLPLAEPGAFGIFPTIARVNHSCRPNTNHYQVEGVDPQVPRRPGEARDSVHGLIHAWTIL